jgi:uncharacterized membrane protein YqjE
MADRFEPVSAAGAARARDPEEVTIVGDRSTVDLIKDIATNIQGIVRSEIRLANLEMKEKATKASRAAIALAAGGVLMLYAFGFLLTCIYQAINVALWPWLSALLVFIGLAIAGGMLLAMGRNRLKQVNPKPAMTVQAVKEDVQWLRTQTR